MTASRVLMSPRTSPWRPTSTCRAARIPPSTRPSIFTTPSVSMSPTIFVPAAMMESALLLAGRFLMSSIPFASLLKIAMSRSLFDDWGCVDRDAVTSHLEMQMRLESTRCISGECDHGAGGDVLSFGDAHFTRTTVQRFVTGTVRDANQLSECRVVCYFDDQSGTCGTDGRTRWDSDLERRSARREERSRHGKRPLIGEDR